MELKERPSWPVPNRQPWWALVEENMQLARWYSKGQGGDYEAAALLGLVVAAKKFDPSRGVPFVAFAKKHIQGEVKKQWRLDNYVKKSATTKWDGEPGSNLGTTEPLEDEGMTGEALSAGWLWPRLRGQEGEIVGMFLQGATKGEVVAKFGRKALLGIRSKLAGLAPLGSLMMPEDMGEAIAVRYADAKNKPRPKHLYLPQPSTYTPHLTDSERRAIYGPPARLPSAAEMAYILGVPEVKEPKYPAIVGRSGNPYQWSSGTVLPTEFAPPKRKGEQLCPSCFLIKRRHLFSGAGSLCCDCA